MFFQLVCILVSVFSVSVCAASVGEKLVSYTCQEGTNTLEAPFGVVDPQCDQSWTTSKKPIAYYENGKGECSFSCEEVFSGKVILRECPNVTLTIGCTTKDGVYEETRLHFSAISRPAVSMTTTNTANNHIAHYGISVSNQALPPKTASTASTNVQHAHYGIIIFSVLSPLVIVISVIISRYCRSRPNEVMQETLAVFSPKTGRRKAIDLFW
ncbi:uncharacterized protein LOC115141018 [Oncorhynchus nerka]|uniref:uncharacterized protein LOC115141018 n=1 Tax=Oncorhynchus nerka TaxID=8023 RepID=UPI0031B8275A